MNQTIGRVADGRRHMLATTCHRVFRHALNLIGKSNEKNEFLSQPINNENPIVFYIHCQCCNPDNISELKK